MDWKAYESMAHKQRNIHGTQGLFYNFPSSYRSYNIIFVITFLLAQIIIAILSLILSIYTLSRPLILKSRSMIPERFLSLFM